MSAISTLEQPAKVADQKETSQEIGNPTLATDNQSGSLSGDATGSRSATTSGARGVMAEQSATLEQTNLLPTLKIVGAVDYPKSETPPEKINVQKPEDRLAGPARDMAFQISRSGDLGTGQIQEQYKKIIEEAIKAGRDEDLVRTINIHLQSVDSDYRLDKDFKVTSVEASKG